MLTVAAMSKSHVRLIKEQMFFTVLLSSSFTHLKKTKNHPGVPNTVDVLKHFDGEDVFPISKEIDSFLP